MEAFTGRDQGAPHITHAALEAARRPGPRGLRGGWWVRGWARRLRGRSGCRCRTGQGRSRVPIARPQGAAGVGEVTVKGVDVQEATGEVKGAVVGNGGGVHGAAEHGDGAASVIVQRAGAVQGAGIVSTSLYLLRSGQFRLACGPGSRQTPGIVPNDPSL